MYIANSRATAKNNLKKYIADMLKEERKQNPAKYLVKTEMAEGHLDGTVSYVSSSWFGPR